MKFAALMITAVLAAEGDDTKKTDETNETTEM